MPNVRPVWLALCAGLLLSVPAGGQVVAAKGPPSPFARYWTDPGRNDGDAICLPGDGCGKARAAERRFAAGLRPVEDLPGWCMACDATELTDVLNCDLDIEIAPSTETITGSNTFTIMSKVNGLTTFTFRLRNQFVISSALINGSTPVTVSNPTTTTRIATLDRAYNDGEVFTLKISYSGVPMSIGSFGSVDFTTQNGQPLFQTLSEPYYAYTWWPCKDGDTQTVGDNSDKFTAQVAITAPDTMKSVSNGVLQGVDVVAGNKRKYRWATTYPTTTYLIFVGSTNYNQWSQIYTYPLPGGGNGTMPVEFSIYPANDTAGNRTSWEKCLSMLSTYRTIYGEYPFVNEKYGIYNFNFGGGEEHQTYTGQGTFNESVTSHELGHQWWGDMITCKTWPDIWLNEGFATYTEALWLERRPGSTGLPALFAAMAARRPTQTSGTVYRTDVSSANTIFSNNYSYLKGGWVLHQLRHVVGDSTFFSILAAYRAQYQGSAATTDDFKNVCSAVYGQDLTWFFQEWVYGGGAPAYVSGWNTVNINGQNYLRLRLRQSQAGTPFRMPVDIRVDFASGNQTVTVQNDASPEWFVVPINAPATGIVVDENAWILTTSKTSEAYVGGPPKIVQASPAPGTTLSSAPAQLSVTFDGGVNVVTGNFTLSGPSGSVPCTLSYNATNFTAELTPGVTLPPGAYTLTCSDAITSGGAAAASLDGEITNNVLPSGEGLPGGSGVIGFTIQGPPCYANCDGSTSAPVLTANDFACFLNAYAGGESYANCDGSTTAPTLTANDFACFLNQYAGGCS
jgi:aminopeptidase N